MWEPSKGTNDVLENRHSDTNFEITMKLVIDQKVEARREYEVAAPHVSILLFMKLVISRIASNTELIEVTLVNVASSHECFMECGNWTFCVMHVTSV